ncbi:MAG: hypothetical protein OXG33_04295 [Chloroflexi bacterium]|nr:hypothetical protein [Chloroflexota bacterium]
MRQPEPDINVLAFKIVQAATAEKPVPEPKTTEPANEAEPSLRPTIRKRSARHNRTEGLAAS